MGTCMSKDKRGASAAQAASILSSSSSSSSSSQGKQNQYHKKEEESLIAIPRPPTAEENSFPIVVARPSSAEEGKEPTSTDKHVVKIWLPIASPSMFKDSPASTALANRAMTTIARPVEEERAASASEEDDDEEERPLSAIKSPPKLRNPSPPLLCSRYLSRASFSRDLAAFSRDLASLSCSPLKRSPSVNGAHDRVATAIIKAAHSPQHAYAKMNSNMLFDGYSTTTRSRSLPKRFYSKDSDANLPPFHKRSSSRDAASRHQKSFKRMPPMDPSCELGLSPRVSVRREKASGEYRVYARQQAAARRGHHHHHDPHSAPPTAPDIRLTREERSPLRRSSTGKVADADQQMYYEIEHFQEDQNLAQTMHTGALMHNLTRGRSALKDRSTNCSSSWDDAATQGPKGLSMPHVKVLKAKVEEEDLEKDGLGRSFIENELYDEVLPTEMAPLECQDPSFYYSGKTHLSTSHPPDSIAMYSASMDRIHSIIEALEEMNIESSLLSEFEESETEVKGEIDLLQFAFDVELSPEKELQAQQARNMLLKEAAMDAFARPNFYSIMDPGELQEGRPPSSGLAASMAMKPTDSEADTLKIHKVLKLLSMAESEMEKEQKTGFYNQLSIVLDSVKTRSLVEKKDPHEGIQVLGTTKEKAVTLRANSWPRSVKEPAHMVTSMDSSPKGMIAQLGNNNMSQDSSLKVVDTSLENFGILPLVTNSHGGSQDELSISIKHPLTVHEGVGGGQALESDKHDLKGDYMQIPLQEAFGGDMNKLSCLDVNAEQLLVPEHSLLANQVNEQIIPETDQLPIANHGEAAFSCADEFPLVQLEQETVRDNNVGSIDSEKLETHAVDDIDEHLPPREIQDLHYEKGPMDGIEIAACTERMGALIKEEYHSCTH